MSEYRDNDLETKLKQLQKIRKERKKIQKIIYLKKIKTYFY